MNRDDLVERVGAELYARACEYAWATAAGTGTGGNAEHARRQKIHEENEEAALVPCDLADVIWYGEEAPWVERVRLAMQLYREMPCYANLVYFIHSYEEHDEDTKRLLWAEYRWFLSDDDDRLADPIGYSLAVAWFEDVDTVDESRAAVAYGELSPRGVEQLLEAAQAVSYRLKAKLYDSLIADARWHLRIYKSVLNSVYATYGDVDPAAAQGLLARLDIAADTEHLTDLSERLAEMKRRGLTRWTTEAELDLRFGAAFE